MPTKKSPARKNITLHVRGMVCNCCIRIIRQLLGLDGITIHDIRLGVMTLSYDPLRFTPESIGSLLTSNGFELISNKEKILVEEIKLALIELIHHSTYNAMVRNSDYLVERFGMSYPYLSSLFSRHESTTLERFTILHKVEKVKELIQAGDMTLSEIAYTMGYSSVQYLSTQFRSVTGISVTDYRNLPAGDRKSLDRLTDNPSYTG